MWVFGGVQIRAFTRLGRYQAEESSVFPRAFVISLRLGNSFTKQMDFTDLEKNHRALLKARTSHDNMKYDTIE